MTDASMRWETAIGFEPTGIDLVGEVAVVYRDAGAGPGTAVGLELSNHGDLTWRHQGAELLHRQGTAHGLTWLIDGAGDDEPEVLGIDPRTGSVTHRVGVWPFPAMVEIFDGLLYEYGHPRGTSVAASPSGCAWDGRRCSLQCSDGSPAARAQLLEGVSRPAAI